MNSPLTHVLSTVYFECVAEKARVPFPEMHFEVGLRPLLLKLYCVDAYLQFL